MLIAIDAGHGLNTPGKRCLKSIDPNETREFALNSRIAEKVQARLSGYVCDYFRVDDPTGAEDVPLSRRVLTANSAGADVYLSIHHNAGVNGGSGGGIVVIVGPGSSAQSKVLQEAIYRHTVATTGLSGNRANPMPESNLFVLNRTTMPAVLGEFGFMDSTTDTPIILTDEYADKVADGITAALVEVYALQKNPDVVQETDPGYEQFKKYMERYRAELASLPVSDWAAEGVAEAVRLGIMADGSRPRDYVTRQEAAIMAKAAVYAD